MKTSKRLFAFALTLMLLLSLGASAFADDAQFKVTQDFMKELLTVEGFSCEAAGTTSDSSGEEYEFVKVSYAGGDISPYKSNAVMNFNKNGEEFIISMFNLIRFSENDLAKLLQVINDINAETSGVKLYIDSSDNTVTGEMYQLATPETCTDLALSALGFLIGFTDEVYQQLSAYDVA